MQIYRRLPYNAELSIIRSSAGFCGNSKRPQNKCSYKFQGFSFMYLLAFEKIRVHSPMPPCLPARIRSAPRVSILHHTHTQIDQLSDTCQVPRKVSSDTINESTRGQNHVRELRLTCTNFHRACMFWSFQIHITNYKSSLTFLLKGSLPFNFEPVVSVRITDCPTVPR